VAFSVGDRKNSYPDRKTEMALATAAVQLALLQRAKLKWADRKIRKIREKMNISPMVCSMAEMCGVMADELYYQETLFFPIFPIFLYGHPMVSPRVGGWQSGGV
jgi:hypothetical protein